MIIFLLKDFPLIFLDGFLVKADLFLTHGILFLDDKVFLFFQNVSGKPQSQRNEIGRAVITHGVASGTRNCSGFLVSPDPKMDAILALRSSHLVENLHLYSIFPFSLVGRKEGNATAADSENSNRIARFWFPRHRGFKPSACIRSLWNLYS